MIRSALSVSISSWLRTSLVGIFHYLPRRPVGLSDSHCITPYSVRLVITLLATLFLTACATLPTDPKPAAMPQAAPAPQPAEPTTATYQIPTLEEEAITAEPKVEALPTGPSPAVRALVERAQMQHNQGDVGAALATMERAVQIEPESALVWLDLARLRLVNGEPQQAEQLALRAVEHAADERTRSLAWQTVARARLAQGDRAGAEDAQRRAGMHAL